MSLRSRLLAAKDRAGERDPEDWMPPAPRASVEILRAKGHTVVVRENRNGSLRYSVDGAPETDALTMSRRYRKYGL